MKATIKLQKEVERILISDKKNPVQRFLERKYEEIFSELLNSLAKKKGNSKKQNIEHIFEIKTFYEEFKKICKEKNINEIDSSAYNSFLQSLVKNPIFHYFSFEKEWDPDAEALVEFFKKDDLEFIRILI